MKAIVSTTYDDKYLFFLPIATWCWNKLGVDVICFMPEYSPLYKKDKGAAKKRMKTHLLAITTIKINGLACDVNYFTSPEYKEATYAQCSRLYGACLDLPEDEILVTSDVDMALFKIPEYISGFTITGQDLVPEGQYPVCYVAAQVKDWRKAFSLSGLTYQRALDRLLGEDECQDYRACRWSVDQEQLYKNIFHTQILNLIPRTNGQNQFATKRYDRDDTYILDRLSPDTIDFHMNRPGYEEKNFEIIMTVLKYHYPNENFQWLIDYRDAYLKLL